MVMVLSEELDPEEIRRLYEEEGLSVREIARKLGVSKGKIDYIVDKYGIERRSLSEAIRLSAYKSKTEAIEEAKAILEESLKQLHVKKRKYSPIRRFNILVPLSKNNNKDCTLTIVISDLHIGDANHLPDTYWSTIANLLEILKFIKENYNIKELYLVLNGDIVSGRDVYKFQELRNLLERGHWQVFMAEYIIRKTIEDIERATNSKITKIYLTRGTHEALANNFILYLKRIIGDKTRYLSHGGIVNIAGNLGEYYVLFTHGIGGSRITPIPSILQTDVFSKIDEYRRNNFHIERVCTSHTHWLTSSIFFDGVFWDVTGGFMKWEKTLSNRIPGIIVYFYNDGEVSSIPVTPDMEVYRAELNDPGLEYKNLKYYGDFLLKHLKEIEKIDSGEG